MSSAEDKLERVRVVRELLAPGTTARALIDDALADVEPFELPAEFGTKFWAKTAANVWIEFNTCAGYFLPATAPDKRIFVTTRNAAYDPGQVMTLFKEHTREQPQVKASERAY